MSVGLPNYNGLVCSLHNSCRGCQGIAEGWHQRRPFCFPVKSTWDLQFVTYSIVQAVHWFILQTVAVHASPKSL